VPDFIREEPAHRGQATVERLREFVVDGGHDADEKRAAGVEIPGLDVFQVRRSGDVAGVVAGRSHRPLVEAPDCVGIPAVVGSKLNPVGHRICSEAHIIAEGV
jgi:hypothetical protein